MNGSIDEQLLGFLKRGPAAPIQRNTATNEVCMSITLTEDGDACRMAFNGCITYEFWREQEDIIIDAMRRYTHFSVDLSGIEEIDLCGIHLLGVLHSVGGQNVTIVAASSIVDQASRRLLASQRLASLGRAARRAEVLNHQSIACQAGADYAA